MKSLYLILGMICLNAYGQKLENTITADMPCYNTKEIFTSLREKYKELPFMTGQVDDEAKSVVSIWMNPVENNWTILATKKDITCVIGMGTDMKIVSYKKGTSI